MDTVPWGLGRIHFRQECEQRSASVNPLRQQRVVQRLSGELGKDSIGCSHCGGDDFVVVGR